MVGNLKLDTEGTRQWWIDHGTPHNVNFIDRIPQGNRLYREGVRGLINREDERGSFLDTHNHTGRFRLFVQSVCHEDAHGTPHEIAESLYNFWTEPNNFHLHHVYGIIVVLSISEIMTSVGIQLRCFPEQILTIWWTGLHTLLCIATFCLGGRVTFILPETVDNQGWNPGHRERVNSFIDNTIALIKRYGMYAHRGTNWTKAMTFDEKGFLKMTVNNMARRNNMFLTYQTLLDCSPNQVCVDDYESSLLEEVPHMFDRWLLAADDRSSPSALSNELKLWIRLTIFVRKSGVQIDAIQDKRIYNVEEHEDIMETIRQRCQLYHMAFLYGIQLIVGYKLIVENQIFQIFNSINR